VRVHHLATIYTAGSFFADSNFGSDRSTSDHHDVLQVDPDSIATIDTERIGAEVGFMVSLPPHVNMASATLLPLGSR